MNEKLYVTQAVIVEGKYDKIKLDAVLDALIIPTGGFGIFSDNELREFIKNLAAQRGLIVVTDSDAAGFRIRKRISDLVPPESITHVFIPDIFGKESRKSEASKEGKLGVEGMAAGTLREAFARAGIGGEMREQPKDPITRFDLYEDGFSGGKNSQSLRFALYDRLGLPRRLGVSAALPLLNRIMTRGEYKTLAREIKNVCKE